MVVKIEKILLRRFSKTGHFLFLQAGEQSEWKRLHSIIYRATHESPTERLRDFRTLADVIQGSISEEPTPIKKNKPQRKRRSLLLPIAAALALLIAWVFLSKEKDGAERILNPTVESVTLPALSLPQSGVSNERKLEFDTEASYIIKKLDNLRSGSMEEYKAFTARLEVLEDYIVKFSKMDRSSSGSKDKSQALLLKIHNEFRFLANHIPKTTASGKIQKANELLESLFKNIYAEATTADEKLYLKDKIRPYLDRKFEDLFVLYPGIKLADPTTLNLKFNLPLLNGGDEKLLEEIEKYMEQIHKGLNPQ
ncbi:MAG: hypothetical protein ACK5LK_08630 [Chthoniobacterales bacterium]